MAQKNQLMGLSYDLFKLEFEVSEVKEALDRVRSDTACMCPRIRDQVEKIDIRIIQGQYAMAVRFDEIKRPPDLQVIVTTNRSTYLTS